MHLGVLAKMEEHPEPIGQREGGDVRIEMRIALHQVTQCRQKLFVDDQSVAAGMGCNDSGAFVQGEAESIWVAE